MGRVFHESRFRSKGASSQRHKSAVHWPSGGNSEIFNARCAERKVKTFTQEEFETIYCEREWRSITPFKFDYSDISMIVVPRNVDSGNHFERLIAEAPKIGLPPTVSIVAWEDLVEH
jgi:hypothetical protein